ncbi:hypothetical protein DFS33DRAFT_122274 [Desarmillaria ectypa]|nr:hypothetical protein DFS33DRAFT_122274 [Desarmillaria ectypa]
MILTSKLNTVTTVFIDQESAISIAIQDNGEVELSITRDCTSQSIAIDPLNPLDEPEAPEPLRSSTKDTSASSPIDLVDPYTSPPVREPQIPTTHASNPISSPSNDSSGGMKTRPSSTQAAEIPSLDCSPPGRSTHEPPKTRNTQVSGLVSQHTSFEDPAPRGSVVPSTPSLPLVVRISPLPPDLTKPDLATTSSPSLVAARDQTTLDVQQTHFLSERNRVPLPSPRASIPPPRSKHWDRKWDAYPQETVSQRSGSLVRRNYLRETGSQRPSYPSPEEHSSLPSVAKDTRHKPLSDRPVGLNRTKDPRRRSPVRRSLQVSSPASLANYQSEVPEPKLTSRPSKSRLPSFKKIRGTASSSLTPSSTSATDWSSSPLPPGLCTAESRSIQASTPISSRPDYAKPDAQVNARLHDSAAGDYSYSSSSLSSTSARRSFYSQSDHPYRRTESSSSVYSERLELYSSKKGTLTSYMTEKFSLGTGHLSNTFRGQAITPSSCCPPGSRPPPQISATPPAPIIKEEEAHVVYPFRPPHNAQSAREPLTFISKRSSSPPLQVLSATSPPNNLLKKLHPSSLDSLYAPLPRMHDSQPLNVPSSPGHEDTYMLDEVPFSREAHPPSPPPTIVPPTEMVGLPPSVTKPPPLPMFLQGEHNANTIPLSPSLSSRSEEERNLPTISQSDVPCEGEAGWVSNTHEVGQNGRLQRQSQVEKTANTDLARHKRNGLHSTPQGIEDASNPNPSTHENLETIGPDIQQSTNNEVALPEQSDLGSLRADVLDIVAPIADETGQIAINDLPEVQQFADTDFPVLLFVPLPGYGYASLGYFCNLGIVSKTSTDESEGRRTMWRVRLRWVADEKYDETEDETTAKGCWWSEQRVLGLEDKLVRGQCPSLGICMRAVERWWCRGCGRVNREDGWKWRRCLSEKCKEQDKQPEFLKALSLDDVRGRNDRMPMVRPHDMASVPGIMTTTWEDGTVTYMYPLSSSCLVKHVFTGNYPPLQEDASKIWMGLQGKGVELIRGPDGPYYTCAFGGNSDDWPGSVTEASEVVGDSAVGYGEFPSGMDIQRVEVLAWFIKGSTKFKAHETGAVGQVLRAKQNLVGILSLGCEVEVVLHKCRAVAELPSLEGLLTLKAEDGTEQVAVDAEPSTAKPTSPRKKKVADVGDLSIHMVHGDVLILSGDDFEYNIKRSGSGMLVIASSDV